MKYNYYAIYGANAVLVRSDFFRAKVVRDRYMQPPCNIEGFANADDALAAARSHLVKIAGKYRIIPEYLEVNKFYSTKRLPRKKTEDGGECINE